MIKVTAVMLYLFLIGLPAIGMAQTVNSSLTHDSSHEFWDKTNVGLFAGVAASRMMDYASTQYFRRRGVNEALLTNRIVDNKSLFIGIELSGTAASMGIAYLFHMTGRHKLERWTSAVHIGVTTFGFARNYMISRDRPIVRR
jgi:hypothetical protein